MRNDSIIPGPECFATIPVNTKIPVPITAPIPKKVKSSAVNVLSSCRGDSVLSAFFVIMTSFWTLPVFHFHNCDYSMSPLKRVCKEMEVQLWYVVFKIAGLILL